jgi:hypothetical protein
MLARGGALSKTTRKANYRWENAIVTVDSMNSTRLGGRS